MTLATIFVSDLEPALEFYTITLGFKNNSFNRPHWMAVVSGSEVVPGQQMHDVPLPSGAEVSPDGADIVIALRVEEAHVGNGRKFPPVMPTSRLWAVLGLHTDDLHAKCRDLQEKGVEFFFEPELEYIDRGSNQLRICAAILDPDGNIIWLEEQLEEGDPGPIELQNWKGASE